MYVNFQRFSMYYPNILNCTNIEFRIAVLFDWILNSIILLSLKECFSFIITYTDTHFVIKKNDYVLMIPNYRIFMNKSKDYLDSVLL